MLKLCIACSSKVSELIGVNLYSSSREIFSGFRDFGGLQTIDRAQGFLPALVPYRDDMLLI